MTNRELKYPDTIVADIANFEDANEFTDAEFEGDGIDLE